MHKIQVELGIRQDGAVSRTRVLLDETELNGVREVRIVSDAAGVTSVTITLVASVVAEIVVPT